MDNRLILALASHMKVEVPSAGRHHNALLAFDSPSSLLCYNIHMLSIRTQRRSSPRIKLIQSLADRAIPIDNSKYPNIKWMMNWRYKIKKCLSCCISCDKVFKIGACGIPATVDFCWWQKEEKKNYKELQELPLKGWLKNSFQKDIVFNMKFICTHKEHDWSD